MLTLIILTIHGLLPALLKLSSKKHGGPVLNKRTINGDRLLTDRQTWGKRIIHGVLLAAHSSPTIPGLLRVDKVGSLPGRPRRQQLQQHKKHGGRHLHHRTPGPKAVEASRDGARLHQ